MPEKDSNSLSRPTTHNSPTKDISTLRVFSLGFQMMTLVVLHGFTLKAKFNDKVKLITYKSGLYFLLYICIIS